jgi:hypothetical protein
MLRAHFGIGSSTTIINMTIRWPSGVVQSIGGISPDQIIRVVEDEDTFAFDCNRNCVSDLVDIAEGLSQDTNGNGIPDECECITDTDADINGDGSVNVIDLLIIISNWDAEGSSEGDVDGDGIVGIQDLLLLIGAWSDC